jgi:sulfide:quinone oxidoreductase
VHPERNQVELTDGRIVDYDVLIIATGPKLAFDEVPTLGPNGHAQSICQVEHAVEAGRAWDDFVKNPGPIVVGAVQGAFCFGPGYEFAFIMDTDLRKRKTRDRVPMTFVTAEPYIGHLGLGGVGDPRVLLEAAMRERHVKWICNAKVTKVEAGKMFVAEHNDRGEVIKEHDCRLPTR